LRERAVGPSRARSDRVRDVFVLTLLFWKEPLTRLAPAALATLSLKGRG
jgi:hypothetical protein